MCRLTTLTILIFCCTVSVLVSGCSDPYANAPVRGLVTFDGEPLKKGMVIFSPQAREGVSAAEPGRQAFGVIDETGHYELITGQEKGAIIAPHKIHVRDAEWKGRQEAEAAGDARLEALKKAKRAAGDRNRARAKILARAKVTGETVPEEEKVDEPKIPDGPELPLYAPNHEIKTVQVVSGENTINIELTEQKRGKGDD